jgi:hypothetical protein
MAKRDDLPAGTRRSYSAIELFVSGRKVRNRRLLVTTDTQLKATAAPP